MKEQLCLRRLWLLVRGDLVGDWRRLALIAGTAAGAVLLLSLAAGSSSFPESSFHRRWFVILLFLVGIPATCQALRPFHDRTLREAYLLLPASILEKGLARLLATTVVLTLLMLAFSALLSLVIESLNLFVFFGDRRPFFDPVEAVLWQWIAAYIVVQSPYFLGAAWFRRWPGIKTTLVLVLLLVALAAVALLSEFGFGVSADAPDVGGEKIFSELVGYFYVRADIVYAILVLTPIAFWSLAWLRLRKIQADNAI